MNKPVQVYWSGDTEPLLVSMSKLLEIRALARQGLTADIFAECHMRWFDDVLDANEFKGDDAVMLEKYRRFRDALGEEGERKLFRAAFEALLNAGVD
jgi:hypothetical protein